MNFVENNGSKIAAVLCVASCIPVVATIYAQGNQPGTQGDDLVNGEAKVAKGWQEIEGKSWFFKENGNVDKDAEKVSAATVSTSISDNVAQNIVGTTKQYVEEVNSQEAEITEEVIYEELEAPVLEAEETVIPEDTYVEEVVETPVVEEVYEEAPVVEEVYEEEVEETPVVEEVYEEEIVEEDEEEAPSVEEVYEEEILDDTPIYEDEEVIEDEEIYEEVVEEPTYEEDYIYEEVVEEPIYDDYTYEATSTGQAIADAAMGLVGVTNGWQCTEVATQALINAGVQGVPVCWPDQYQYYGTVTYDASVGSLAYYYNGGRGYDHIAVYVGDGMCVHGNFDGQTIYYSETTADGSPDYYVVFE